MVPEQYEISNTRVFMDKKHLSISDVLHPKPLTGIRYSVHIKTSSIKTDPLPLHSKYKTETVVS